MAVGVDEHKLEEGRRKKEEGRRKKEEGRRKKEEGRRKKEDRLSGFLPSSRCDAPVFPLPAA
ncbi:hypothetical protein ACGTN6_08855 [Halomonas sp. THAF12]|uniref:hypothetical protein n=1 Tax=Halomonas sp. B23F22_10 TaxID=3459515 RepID=UPI00373E4FCC